MAIESVRVPLEAHTMSKCPDARYCLQELIVPTMAEVHHKVDFQLSFIGTYVSIFLGAAHLLCGGTYLLAQVLTRTDIWALQCDKRYVRRRVPPWPH